MFVTALLLTGAAVALLIYGTGSKQESSETAAYVPDPTKTGDNIDTSEVQDTFRAPDQHADVLADVSSNYQAFETRQGSQPPLPPPAPVDVPGHREWFGDSEDGLQQVVHAAGHAMEKAWGALRPPVQGGLLKMGDAIPWFDGGKFTDVHYGGQTFTRQEANDYLQSTHPNDTKLGRAVAEADRRAIEQKERTMIQNVMQAVALGQDLPPIPQEFHEPEAKRAYLKARKSWVETMQNQIRAGGGTVNEYYGRHLQQHEEERPRTPPPPPPPAKNKPGSVKPSKQGGGTGRDMPPGDTQALPRDGGH